MTVKDIVKCAAEILQADDIADTLDSDVELDSDSKTLIKCVNLAVAETSVDFPVVKSLIAVAENGFIPLDVFDGVLSTVRKVTHFGATVRFSLDTRGICVPNDGTYTVTYTLAPSDANLNEAVTVGAAIDCYMLGYLAARNYCLITGRTDEASIWDQRYNAEAESRRIMRRTVMPPRKFI